MIVAEAQSGRDDADKILLVWAAGNSHGNSCTDADLSECVEGKVVASSPAVLAGLPVHVEELRSHSVAVVATQRDGTLASFSNRCGVAAQWCVAAPGADLVVAYYGPDREGRAGAYGYSTGGNGTSFAAPLVAGGLAVLKHYFRDQLGNTEVLTRLYETADATPDTVADGEQCPEHLDLDNDRSDCELSSTHGRGLMDLDAATRPRGSMTIALGDTLSGGRVAAASSLLRSGGPAGNALSAAFRGREAAVFDALDAPFWVGLDGFAQAAAEPDLEDRLARFMRPEPRRRDWAGLGAVSVPGVPGGLIEAPFASTRLRLGVNRAGGEGEWWSGGHASSASRCPSPCGWRTAGCGSPSPPAAPRGARWCAASWMRRSFPPVARSTSARTGAGRWALRTASCAWERRYRSNPATRRTALRTSPCWPATGSRSEPGRGEAVPARNPRPAILLREGWREAAARRTRIRPSMGCGDDVRRTGSATRSTKPLRSSSRPSGAPNPDSGTGIDPRTGSIR